MSSRMTLRVAITVPLSFDGFSPASLPSAPARPISSPMFPSTLILPIMKPVTGESSRLASATAVS